MTSHSPSDPQPPVLLPSEAVESSDAPDEATEAASPMPEKSRSWLLWIAIVLWVAVIGAGVYGGIFLKAWYAQVNQALDTQSKASADAKQSFLRIETDLTEYGQSDQQVRKQMQSVEGVAQSLSAKAQNIAQAQNKRLDQMSLRLDGQQKRINSMSTTNREDWLLAEAEYLLRLANQRVLLERSPQNAIALLESADEIVKEVAAGLGDAELFGIREALGRELTQLRLIDTADKEGVYLQLSALANAVESLPRTPGSSFDKSAGKANVETAVTPADSWRARMWQTIKETVGVLDQYIKIDSTDVPAVPLLSDESALVVAMNVRLLLQQAQFALLKEQVKVYQYSLMEAKKLIVEYYVPSASVTRFVQQIDAVAAVNVAPELPDVTGSVKLLHGYIEKLHSQ